MVMVVIESAPSCDYVVLLGDFNETSYGHMAPGHCMFQVNYWFVKNVIRSVAVCSGSFVEEEKS